MIGGDFAVSAAAKWLPSRQMRPVISGHIYINAGAFSAREEICTGVSPCEVLICGVLDLSHLEVFPEILPSIKTLWLALAHSWQVGPNWIAGRGRNQDQLENRSHVVPFNWCLVQRLFYFPSRWTYQRRGRPSAKGKNAGNTPCIKWPNTRKAKIPFMPRVSRNATPGAGWSVIPTCLLKNFLEPC